MDTITGTIARYWKGHPEKPSVDIKKLEHTMDSLNAIIASEAIKRAEYDKTISSLKDSILNIENQLQTNDERLKNLKKDYEKKLADINNFNSNDIERYFTNRYGK